MYGQYTLYRAVCVAYFVAKICFNLNEFGSFTFQLPLTEQILAFYVLMKKKREIFVSNFRNLEGNFFFHTYKMHLFY